LTKFSADECVHANPCGVKWGYFITGWRVG
jgi:hypothetical protein